MTASPLSRTGSTPSVTESSPEDLAVLRYLLDLALQPLDRFDGFTHSEQMLLSALRYQLNACAKSCFTPRPCAYSRPR